jgi:hypothetical protein
MDHNTDLLVMRQKCIIFIHGNSLVFDATSEQTRVILQRWTIISTYLR